MTDAEKTMLAIEAKWWRNAGAKEAYIRERLDMSPVSYYQRLNRLIDTQAAMAHDPITVKRLLGRRTGQRIAS